MYCDRRVERFFATITTRRIRRGTFEGVPALEAATESYLVRQNELCTDRTPGLNLMCGIYGQLGFSDDDTQHANAATDTMIHRGPDGRGVWHGDGVFIGMRRLSIIDLAGGNQPIWNEDSSCAIVCNGEIYNYRELRAELESKGHVFRTQSDVETVLHGYEQWGTQMLKRLNGMFGFAIWDRLGRRLFIARDRIGEKPLYYWTDGRRLVFASEIKAIVTNPAVPRQLRLRGLANFMAFGHAVAPDTMYEGIVKLLPGHSLLAVDGRIEVSKYWDVGDEPQIPAGAGRSEDENAERLLALLSDSVRMRMVADVPVGAFLSGGVDSSAIVALMKRHAHGPVKTFSLGFSIGGAYNELSEARQVATALDTEHHELNVEHVDLVATLRTLVWHYDEPFGDPAAFPLYLLSKFASKQVKVVLCGDGGDELFGGYRRYAADQASAMYRKLPPLLTHSLIPALADRLSRFRRIKRTLRTLPIADPATRYASWLVSFTPEMQEQLIRPEFRQPGYDPAWAFPHYYGELNGSSANDHLNRMMFVDLKSWLPDAYMEKSDKATMACGLEGRLPLLDHRLVELAFQIPGEQKVQGKSLKRILKRAARDLVPSDVLTRPKHGFAVPLDPWFRGELKDYTFDVLLDARTRSRGYFDSAYVERLWREHVEGREVWDAQLYFLLNFELWHRIHLDGDAV